MKRLACGLILLCCVLFLSGKPVQAQEDHGGGMSLPPRQMGAILLQMGQYQPAAKIYSELFESESSDSEVVRGLVKSHAGMGQLDSVLEDLKAALQKNQKSSSLLYGIGLAVYIQQKPKEAESFLSKALEQDPTNASALNTLAVVRFDQQRYAEAIPLLNRAVEARPQDLLVYRNLWRTYAAMNQTSQFLEVFEKAKQEGTHDLALGYGRAYAGALRQEGFSLYKNGDRSGAMEKMKAMLDVYRQVNHVPGEVSALFSLGLLDEEEGHIEKARKWYQELLKISPDHIQARQRLQELK